MSDNLGIRSRRSKRTKPVKKVNAITDHTLEDDLPMIRDFAKMFDEQEEHVKLVVNQWVFVDKNLDFYYGSYVAYFQAFTMAHQANNEMASSFMPLIHCVSKRIVDVLDKEKNEDL
jgi:hypothetical protein